MKSFIVALLSVSCLIVAIKAAAVEPVVAELQKDNVEKSATEVELPTNEDCIQSKETGRCFALFYRFAYDVEKHECVEFIYGGCAGNSNNFETKDDCEQKCLKTKPEMEADNKDVSNTTVTPTAEAEVAVDKVNTEKVDADKVVEATA